MDSSTTIPVPLTQRIGRLYAGFATLLDRLQPLAAFAMRFYVGKAFFLSGLTKLRSWDSTLALFQNEYKVPVLSPALAALSGTAAELALPVLLVAGLGTRAAALALFVFNIVAAISYPDISAAGIKDHVLWGTLLALIAVYGPGKLSLDGWFARNG
jgi:putative oxidoreductase